MYVDGIALVFNSPIMLQAMLDIVFDYARRGQYQLNGLKSLVMVVGESAAVRQRERMTRVWKLGESVISEVDEQHHLGILRLIYNSTVHRTNERATAARSAFFVLSAVGSHFGCLHPLTSLRFYWSICLPIMLYGCEVWTFSKTELLFLERVHRKVLKTIQGLPIRERCC